MSDEPTAPDAQPRSEAVPDSIHEVGEADKSANVADFAEGVADAMLTDASLDEATPEWGEAATTRLEAPVRIATQKRSGKEIEASPLLTLPKVKSPEAIALFVHGGDVTSNVPARRGDPAYLRIVPFARDVERRSGGRIGSAMLRLSMRGWNDPDLPAVHDTQWALRVLRRQYPGLPIALVGHSMGGRVVLHLGPEDGIAARVLLAPWASDVYEADDFLGSPLLALHGKHDTVTDPKATRDLVERIEAAGGQAKFVSFPGWHAMLLRPQRWHKVSSEFLIDTLLD